MVTDTASTKQPYWGGYRRSLVRNVVFFLAETKYLELTYRQNALFSILYIWGWGLPNEPDSMFTYAVIYPTQSNPFHQGAFPWTLYPKRQPGRFAQRVVPFCHASRMHQALTSHARSVAICCGVA